MERDAKAPLSSVGGGAVNLPVWFSSFDGFAWAADPAGRLVYVNSSLARVLGKPASEWIGASCASVFDLHEVGGERFCADHCVRKGVDGSCVLRAELRGARSLGMLRLCMLEHHDAQSGARLYLHVAEPDERSGAIDYVRALAQRSAERASRSQALTRAERRVLEALCQDRTAPQIADELNCSVVTVRNHIQHLLRKLGAHSIPEAVARHLLRER